MLSSRNTAGPGAEIASAGMDARPTLVPNCYVFNAKPSAPMQIGVVSGYRRCEAGNGPSYFSSWRVGLPHLRFRMVGGPSGEVCNIPSSRIKEAAAAIPNLEVVGFVPLAEIDAHFDAARVFMKYLRCRGIPEYLPAVVVPGIPTVSFFDTRSTINGKRVVTLAGDLDEMVVYVDRLMQEQMYWRKTGELVKSCYQQFHSANAVMETYERMFATLWKPLDEASRSGLAAMPASELMK